MKHVLTILAVITTFIGFSQTAVITTPDAQICLGETAQLSSCTSVAGSSPIINSIWSVTGPGNFNGSSAPCVNFTFVPTVNGTYNVSLTNQHQNGTTSFTQMAAVITVNSTVNADISAVVTSCNIPFGVQYGIGSSDVGAGITYNWAFETGTPPTFTGEVPPVITYTAVGDYDVTLTVTNTLTGCTDTELRTMNVQNYVSDFTAPATACVGEAVQLTDNSTVGVNTWNWSTNPALGVTGNGIIGGQGTPNPTITYTAPGDYTIDLSSSNTVVPCNGVAQTATITILPLPVPSFTLNPDAGCAPLQVSFSNTSATAGATFEWNYGDGSPLFAGAASPSHTFQGNGSYTVTLNMTGSNGCKASVTDGVTLSSPIAHFSTDIREGCAGTDVHFTDLSVTPAPITTWLWNFGDGTTSNSQNPTHAFPCGEFEVTLTITIAGGCTDMVGLRGDALDSVFMTPTGGFSTLLTDPNYAHVMDTVMRFGTLTSPHFTLDHRNDCIKKPFELVDMTVIACPHDPADVVRTWYINNNPDGSDSAFTKTFPDTLQNISPFNQLPGTDVALELNFRGCKDSIQTHNRLYISAPVSKFQIAGNLFCDINQQPFPLAKSVSIIDAQSVYSHSWPTSLTIFDSLIPSKADDDIRLTYRWGDGTADLIENTDSFLDDNDKGESVDPALSTAQTSGAPVTHTYTDYGTYTVWQVIENMTTGCADSTNTIINISWISTDYVFDEPATDDDFFEVCIGQTAGADQTSSTFASHGPMNYSFSTTGGFVDLSGTLVTPINITGADPQTNFQLKPFNGPGVYPILLTTENAVGCAATATGTLTVYDLPSASFSLNDVVGCIGVPYVSTATNTSTHPAGSFGASGAASANWAGTDAFTWTFNNVNPVTTTNYSQTVPTTVSENTTVTLVATDAFGCVSNPFSLVAVVQQPSASLAGLSQVCSDDIQTGVISATTSGNIASYIWVIDGVSLPASNIASFPFPPTWELTEPATTGNHTIGLKVTDTEGCEFTATDQAVTVIKPRVAFDETLRQGTAVAGQTSEFKCPTVIIDFANTSQAGANTPITTFNWYFNNFDPNLPFPGELTSTQENPLGIQYGKPGSYDLTFVVGDAAGCSDTIYMPDYITIGGPTATATVAGDPNDDCNQLFSFNVSNMNNVSGWRWELGDGTTISSSNEPDNAFTYSYSGVQTYSSVLYVKDDQDCEVPYAVDATVNPNGVVASFTLSPEEISLGTTVEFTNLSTSATLQVPMFDTLIWNYGDGIIDTLLQYGGPNHQYAVGGEIPITLIAIDADGCRNSYTLTIDIDVNLILPNVLTGLGSNGPNADLLLFADVFKDFDFLVVNRWGNVVYEGKRNATNPRFLWNGIDQKSGKLCQDGTYFYIIKGTLKNDEAVSLQGFVSLVATTRK